MLSSILPHTRSCKASREGGAFSGLVCLDRKCAWSASSNDFEVQYLSVSGASFFGLKARACGSLSVPVLERYNLVVRPASQCPGLSPALSLDVVPFILLCKHFIAMPEGRISGLFPSYESSSMA